MRSTDSSITQSSEQAPIDRDRAQRLIEREAIPFGLQSAFGESFLGPYGVYLGAPKPLVALLSTVPLLFGAVLQPLALKLMARFRNRPNLVCLLTLAQSFTWLPIIAIGYAGMSPEMSGLALLGATVFFYLTGMLSGPIWNSLIGDLLEPRHRVDALSRRNLYAGSCMLFGFLVVGSLLRVAADKDLLLFGFVITFSLAALSRLVSSIMLSRHPNPDFESPDVDSFSFWQFLERSYESNFLKFVLFVAVTNLAIHISAPFITVYLLRDLRLDYTHYSIAIASGFFFQLLVMRRWSSILQEVGSRRVLMIATIGFAVTPFLWLVSSNLWWLCFVSGIRGALGAGYQLSVSTFLFDAVTPAKRARCAAYQSIINNFSIVIGALCGGWIVSVVPRVEGLGLEGLQSDSNILLLFLLSGIVNVITLAFLTSFREVREVQHRPTASILFHLAYLRGFGEVLVRVSGQERRGNDSSEGSPISGQVIE